MTADSYSFLPAQGTSSYAATSHPTTSAAAAAPTGEDLLNLCV